MSGGAILFAHTPPSPNASLNLKPTTPTLTCTKSSHSFFFSHFFQFKPLQNSTCTSSIFYSSNYPLISSHHQLFKHEIVNFQSSTSRRPSTLSSDFASQSSDEDFVVVNFYHFVYVRDPEDQVSKHLSFLQGRDIHGRIYVNEQGINAQFSGPSKDALAYADWLKEDGRFSDILVQVSSAVKGHAFPRLKLRYKSSLVQYEGGISHLPLLDPAMRATPLASSEWKKRLQAMNNVEQVEKSDLKRKQLLLDVRNGYEWDVGHFRGAQRPNVDSFRTTSFGLYEPELVTSDPLAGVDKENTDILMYCTGGIRCDVYSTVLRQKGFQNLYSLHGGVSNYLHNEGPTEWLGNLFVFDSRLSVPPSAYKLESLEEGTKLLCEKDTFVKCYICRSPLNEFRHRNCANIDCNLLFLSCSSCVKEYGGCCCLKCTSAPRRRPVLPGHQRYQKWHIYRDTVNQNRLLA